MSGVQRAVCNHLPQLRAESDGEGTLHFDERRRKKNMVTRTSVSVFGLVCLLVLFFFSLEGALAAAVRTLCRRPSRKGAPPR